MFHRETARGKGPSYWIGRSWQCSNFLISGHLYSLKNDSGNQRVFVYMLMTIDIFCIRKWNWALAGVAQWIECGLQTKGSPVLLPVRAHAWVAGQVPSGGHVRGNLTLMFLFLSFSLPCPLSKMKYNKNLLKKDWFLKKRKWNWEFLKVIEK